MLIGELSRRTGVHAHQLRYYEAQGLLGPGRGTNGYRQYASDAILTVNQIRRLLDAGLSTQEIGFMLPCATGAGPDLEPCPELLATLRARLAGLNDHIDTLTRSRRALQDFIDATERRVSGRYQRCDSPPRPLPQDASDQTRTTPATRLAHD